jgi:glucan phosphoethanolaminetransferase (alkaline phosphatase superfamily)
MDIQEAAEILGPGATALIVAWAFAIVLLYGAWFVRRGRISPAQVKRNQRASGICTFGALLCALFAFIQYQTNIALSMGQSHIDPDKIKANTEARNDAPR